MHFRLFCGWQPRLYLVVPLAPLTLPSSLSLSPYLFLAFISLSLSLCGNSCVIYAMICLCHCTSGGAGATSATSCRSMRCGLFYATHHPLNHSTILAPPLLCKFSLKIVIRNLLMPHVWVSMCNKQHMIFDSHNICSSVLVSTPPPL